MIVGGGLGRQQDESLLVTGGLGRWTVVEVSAKSGGGLGYREPVRKIAEDEEAIMAIIAAFVEMDNEPY